MTDYDRYNEWCLNNLDPSLYDDMDDFVKEAIISMENWGAMTFDKQARWKNNFEDIWKAEGMTQGDRVDEVNKTQRGIDYRKHKSFAGLVKKVSIESDIPSLYFRDTFKRSHYDQWENAQKREGRKVGYGEVAYNKRERERHWFSDNKQTYKDWRTDAVKKDVSKGYLKRVDTYMKNHPNANLAQARGHGKRK